MSTQPLLALHAAATLAMGGIIWFVQLVHYPLFELAARADFPAFARLHQNRTGWVVGPLMLAEATTAALLAATVSGPIAKPAWIGVALLAVIWLSTALVQVPLHRRLLVGFDRRAARRLVATNWLRTAAWSARGVLATLMMVGTP